MEEGSSSPSVPNQTASSEGKGRGKGSASGASIEQQKSVNIDHLVLPETTSTSPELDLNPSGLIEEERQDSDLKISSLAGPASALPQNPDKQSQDKGKEPEAPMSYPGDYYHYSRMVSSQTQKDRTTSSTTDRRPETSRSSTNSGSTSSASTPRQGSEAARDNKKDDRPGSGGGGGSASASGGGSSRFRLVAGVFVRY